jgi:hypothetical protein
MMMNNQEIIDNVPHGATHINEIGTALFRDKADGIRSLSDIRRIIVLETQQARAEILIHELHEQVYDNRYLDNRVRLYEVLKEQYDE